MSDVSTQEVGDAVEQTPESVAVEGESESGVEDVKTVEDSGHEAPDSEADPEGAPEGGAEGGDDSAEASIKDSTDDDRAEDEPGEDVEDPDDETAVQRAEFQPLSPKGASSRADNMHLLLDVAVPVTIELGSTEMFLREVLDLGPGAVFKLDRSVGEPVDVLVNGERVGRGEVVVVDDQFGVRMTELLSPDAGNQA